MPIAYVYTIYLALCYFYCTISLEFVCVDLHKAHCSKRTTIKTSLLFPNDIQLEMKISKFIYQNEK